jgi:D-alanyl-D-alanine carboxypeptidase/D-alanyl-D-alanine-endopeptidase (penicillin-binding protein 4)
VILPLLLAAAMPLHNLQAFLPQSRGKTPKSAKLAPAKAASTAGAIHWTEPKSGNELAGDLSSMLSRVKTGKFGVLVYSITTGDTLFERNADMQMLPASTMKLFTSSLALDRFGANGKFETVVLRAGAIGTDGTLRGDLILRGAGDPTLSGKGFEPGTEPPMDALARQIAAAGVKHVSGTVVGDATAFLDGHVPDGWRTRYLQASYAARVSALSFNENKITLLIRPSGGHAELSFQPAVSGLIGAQSAQRDYQVMVEGPELLAAAALRAALVAQGITVDGAVRVGPAPHEAVALASFDSPPLEKIVTQMNGESNNHFAELLFRDAASSAGSPGSAENGNILLRRFLYEKASVAPTSVFAADGSGLSTLDRVTPRAMVQLLGYVKKAPWGSVLESSLPVAGETETLRHRMRYTPAMGNLHAKTGTTNDVASLGGYVTAKNGEQLVFSFIYNGKDRWRAKEAMDAMGSTLASFSR